MPAQISDEDRRQIVRLRALDYDKQEIAEKVGVSRNTVRRHLEDIRNEVENSESPEMKLADFLFDPNELLPYLVEQSGDAIDGINNDILTLIRRLTGNDGN